MAGDMLTPQLHPSSWFGSCVRNRSELKITPFSPFFCSADCFSPESAPVFCAQPHSCVIWTQEILKTALLLELVRHEPMLKHQWVPVHPPARSCLCFSPLCAVTAEAKDRHGGDTLRTHSSIESVSALEVRGMLTERSGCCQNIRIIES